MDTVSQTAKKANLYLGVLGVLFDADSMKRRGGGHSEPVDPKQTLIEVRMRLDHLSQIRQRAIRGADRIADAKCQKLERDFQWQPGIQELASAEVKFNVL